MSRAAASSPPVGAAGGSPAGATWRLRDRLGRRRPGLGGGRRGLLLLLVGRHAADVILETREARLERRAGRAQPVEQAVELAPELVEPDCRFPTIAVKTTASESPHFCVGMRAARST